MKRALLCAILIVVWQAPRLDAQAQDCVVTNGCKPLPCEILAELKLAKAMARAVNYPAQRAGSGGGALNSLIPRMGGPLNRAYLEYQSTCPVRAMPELVVGGPGSRTLCEIGVKDKDGSMQPMTRDQFLTSEKSSQMCSEIVNARYAKAETQSFGCQYEMEGKIDSPTEFFWRNAWQAEERKIESLEASVLKYLSSCTPDAELAQQLSAAGLDALKQAGQQRQAASRANRAVQAAASVGATGAGAKAAGGR